MIIQQIDGNYVVSFVDSSFQIITNLEVVSQATNYIEVMNDYILLACKRFYCCYRVGQKSRRVGTYPYSQYCKVKLVGSKQLAMFSSRDADVVLLDLE